MTFPVAVLLLILPATPPPDPPVEVSKKNIKVLQGLPSSQLIPVMSFMANSLGVTCAHCHGKQFESDEKPAKAAARRMIQLQRSINDQHYGGRLTVTCNTCHQGHVVPPATPDVANAGWNQAPATPSAAVPGEVALAGEAAIEHLPVAPAGVTRRVIRGSVERYNGRDDPKSEPFTLIMGEPIEYHTELSHPPEAKRAFVLYLLGRPLPEQVRGEQWTLTPERVLRERETATPLGNLPDRVELTDFRETTSGRLPFRAQWSRADYRVTYTVESIESDVTAARLELPEPERRVARTDREPRE